MKTEKPMILHPLGDHLVVSFGFNNYTITFEARHLNTARLLGRAAFFAAKINEALPGWLGELDGADAAASVKQGIAATDEILRNLGVDPYVPGRAPKRPKTKKPKAKKTRKTKK